MPLEALPIPLKQQIAAYLSLRDRASLARTCRAMSELEPDFDQANVLPTGREFASYVIKTLKTPLDISRGKTDSISIYYPLKRRLVSICRNSWPTKVGYSVIIGNDISNYGKKELIGYFSGLGFNLRMVHSVIPLILVLDQRGSCKRIPNYIERVLFSWYTRLPGIDINSLMYELIFLYFEVDVILILDKAKNQEKTKEDLIIEMANYCRGRLKKIEAFLRA